MILGKMGGMIMKKYFALFVALCAGLAVSCNTEPLQIEIENANQAGMKAVSITANIDDVTKTSYTGAGVFSWTAGDEISVLCSDGNFYTFTAASTAASSVFSGKIPEGVSLGPRAFFPADAGHDLANYKYNIPESKDLTGHPSAEIPMIATKGEGDVYSFTHCCGAVCLTVTNIPSSIKSVLITVSHPSLKLSGLFGVFTSDGYYRWNPAAASTESEKVFSRKIKVADNVASVYIPYASASDWWGTNTVSVTGYDSKDAPTVLISGKTMSKSIGTTARATIKPLAPLVTSQLGLIDWTDKDVPVFSTANDRIVQWKATSDAYYLYFWYKITTSKVQWDDSNMTYDNSYIYIGFDLDNNAGTGSASSGGLSDGFDAWALIYPFTGATQGTVEYKFGEDPRSWIKNPYGGSSLGKLSVKGGAIDATYSYVEVAIPRSKIGNPASSTVIGADAAMDWYPTGRQSITLQ